MLDPRLLRTFVAVVETASFTRAAGRLHSTQSTVSQHLARLEACVGRRLVDRDARPIVPTPAGERLVGYARRLLALQAEAQRLMTDPSGTTTIRIGVPDDIVTPSMSRRFADFAERHPEVRLDVTTGLSGELIRRFRASDLDIVVAKSQRPEGDARASFPEPLAWFQAAHRTGWPDPLPLVTFPAGGLYRDMMIDQVERTGRQWYIAFTGDSLGSVMSAVEAGLGVSILPIKAIGDRAAVRRCPDVTPDASIILSIYAWEPDGLTAELVGAMTEALAER